MGLGDLEDVGMTSGLVTWGLGDLGTQIYTYSGGMGDLGLKLGLGDGALVTW